MIIVTEVLRAARRRCLGNGQHGAVFTRFTRTPIRTGVMSHAYRYTDRIDAETFGFADEARGDRRRLRNTRYELYGSVQGGIRALRVSSIRIRCRPAIHRVPIFDRFTDPQGVVELFARWTRISRTPAALKRAENERCEEETYGCVRQHVAYPRRRRLAGVLVSEFPDPQNEPLMSSSKPSGSMAMLAIGASADSVCLIK